MSKIEKIHFIGIGGSGISGVAKLAEQFGYEVSGCDVEGNTAYQKNIVKGHDPSHIKDSDIVVVSPALFYQKETNPEVEAAKSKGILYTWQEFLGSILLKDKKLICIAGTHGKSTTTAMAGQMLINAGFDPVVVVGAYVPEWGGNSRFGLGEWAIVEADEFNDNFLSYKPEIAVINNIEFDHPDFFASEEDVKNSFNKFIGNLKGEKILITTKDSPRKHFNLKVFGEHNQKNANMVYVLGKKLGIAEDKIIESIESFEGIGRRMELIADRRNIKVFDDYAHHPTAIASTLEGVREQFPDAKILAVIEPHGYKRNKALLPKYKGVFNSVDKVMVGPIFKARDEVDVSISPQKIADISDHKNILAFSNFDDLFRNLKLEIDNNSYGIIVIMGAGVSYRWAKKIAGLIPVHFSDVTTFGIGGKIQKYIEVRTKEELEEAVKNVKKKGLKIFVLGGGSDILTSDKDFNGVVIKFKGESIIFYKDGKVTAEAGASWDKLVEESVIKNLQGIECMSGIPGTVGASPIQNIGAYGQEIKDVFLELTAYDIDKEKYVIFNKEDCKFGYRESIFKKKSHWQKYIICDVTLKLIKNGKPCLDYKALNDRIKENPTLESVRNAVLQIRKERLEDYRIKGNAGSFYKNPIITDDQRNQIIKKYPDIPVFPFENNYKVPAGWLIDKAGWKGKTYKTAAVSEKNSILLINPDGKAKADDVLELSEKIKSDIYKKFGIKLESEVQLINFD